MNSITLRWALILGITGTLLACSSPDQTAQSQARQGDLMLVFQDAEPDIDPYVTRIIVTPDFLRMDDGTDQSSFTLLDRKQKRIYAVVHENHTILKLEQRAPVKKIPDSLVLDARRIVDVGAPAIDGKVPEHYQLLVNGKVCNDMVAVKDLNEEAVEALREFRRIMSTIHASNLSKTPSEYQDECFLAHDVYAPARVFQFGLPIQQSKANGSTRILLNYDRNYKANPKLFELPEGYSIRTDSDSTTGGST